MISQMTSYCENIKLRYYKETSNSENAVGVPWPSCFYVCMMALCTCDGPMFCMMALCFYGKCAYISKPICFQAVMGLCFLALQTLLRLGRVSGWRQPRYTARVCASKSSRPSHEILPELDLIKAYACLLVTNLLRTATKGSPASC